MNNPENEKTSQMNESFHPAQEPDPMKSAINPPPPMYEPSPSMPYQYQPYTGPPMHGTAPSMPYQYQPYTGPPMHGTAPSMPYQYEPYTGPPMHGTAPSMPYQYHPYTGPPAVVSMQPQQTIFDRNVQPVDEPDYLGYTIFTLLSCCLPLGICGLIYSLRTQGANQRGDITSAKKYSRVALTMGNMALGFGIISIILGGIVVIVSRVLELKAL